MVLWIVTYAGILSNFRESAESPEITARFEKEAYYQRHREEYILDIHTKKDANLKNLRIAALCSLAFAGIFVMTANYAISFLSILNFTGII